MRWLFLFITFFWIICPLAAQYYIAGQEPSSVSWFEKKTPYGKVIYPSGSDTIAFQFNHYMQYAWKNVPISLNHSPKTFPAITHPNSILSNGFVIWAPKRMEIVSQPSLGPSPEPWLLTLSIHETRHIVQVDKLNKGIFRAGTYIMGEQAIGAAVVLVPLWFIEGDAVYTETALSKSGRGRQASFYQNYRTHLLQNNPRKFSYDKWLLGSYKDNIPNHYNFGYLMVGYGNLKYNSNIWINSLDQVTKRPYSFFPFYFSIKSVTGLTRKQFFYEALDYLDSTWRDVSVCEEDISTQVVNNSKNYSEYEHPYMVNDSTIIALKSSLKTIPTFISFDLNKGKEKVLHVPGIITDRVSYRNGVLYWSEYQSHHRWGYLNYSEVWRYDLSTKKATKLTSRSRLFNPIALDNGAILAIEYNSNGNSFIVALSPYGQRVASQRLPFTIEPKEIAVGLDNEFFVKASSPSGALILRFNSIENPPDTVLTPVFLDISNIIFHGNQIIFTITHDGKEDIFALEVKSGKITQLSNSKYGLRNPSIYNNTIMASLWNEMGLYPAIIPPKEIDNIICLNESIGGLFGEGIDTDLQSQPDIESVDTNLLDPIKYSKVKNLFHFHSWAPFYINPFNLMDGQFNAYPGISIFSQNLSSTLATSIGYSYNETHGFHSYIHWMGWYPIISIGVDYGNEFPAIVQGPLGDDDNSRNDFGLEANVRVRFPFRLSSGKYLTQITPGIKYLFNNTWLWNYKKRNYEKYSDVFEAYLSFYSLRRMAESDIRPRFGVYFYSGFSHSPHLSHLKGNNFVAYGGIFFPGLSANHSVLLAGQKEKQWVTGYIFPARLKFPRGYDKAINQGFYSYSFDYSLPLLYPDLPIGSIVYFKRFHTNLFFENAYIYGYSYEEERLMPYEYSLNSTGIELYSDMHFFRTRFELRFGYRVGITLPQKSFFHEFLFSFNPIAFFGHVPKNDFVIFN